MPRNKSEKGWDNFRAFLDTPEFQKLMDELEAKMCRRRWERKLRESKLHKSVLKGEI